MKIRREPLLFRVIERFGEGLMAFSITVGEVVILLFDMLGRLPKLLRHPKLLLTQMEIIGLRSIPLVIFASMFTGAVSAMQAGYQMEGYAPPSLVGAVVGKAVILELGPVLTALVVAGRVSTSIAAELGTMQVTEQIDALETMAIDPIWYLAAPRFFAGFLMMPILVIIGSLVAIVGGYLVSNMVLDVSAPTFFNGVKMLFSSYDVVINQVKSVIFGGVVALSGVYFGYRTSGGAEGVGKSTINAVVTALVLILVFDYLIASVML
ncbi:MlaE family ABC transporter permease [Gemmatimonadota bacterium]